MKKKLVCILICLCFVLLTAVNVNAQIPGIINFQAKIADNNGVPLNELHSFNFSIIDQNSNILWPNDTSVNIPITVENGLYSVKLGDVSLGMEPIPSSIFDENYETYLRIFVDGEQLSDQQILPTGYAFKSEKSDDTHKIAGNPVSGTPQNNQVLKWNGTTWLPDSDDDNQTLSQTLELGNSAGSYDINMNNKDINNIGEMDADYIDVGSGSIRAKEYTSTSSYLGIISDRGIWIDIDNDNNGNEVFSITSDNEDKTFLRISEDDLGMEHISINTSGFHQSYPIYIAGNTRIIGDLSISGSISKSGGTFEIDHPLDPENKVLRHSFIESSERINIYKGRAKLEKGEINIQLPDYFDALNHQEGREIFLTSVNGWSPLFLSGKIINNQFIVKTTKDGNPNQEFSWVIYAVRNDKYAKENPLIVEQEKGMQNGFKKGELLYNKK